MQSAHAIFTIKNY